MVKLSVNINKVATLRNARGGNLPNLLQVALDCEKFGCHGITVHPRPDERHILYSDVFALKEILHAEFNIEGYPSPQFIDLVLKVKPDQVTLVPDAPDAITSNAGWDIEKNKVFLQATVSGFRNAGIRTSLFVEPEEKSITAALATGTDRVELYTEAYARIFPQDREKAVSPYIGAAVQARKCKLGLNAGHDLNLDNLSFFHEQIPGLLEVSIGHALICDALYFGLENTIRMYLRCLKSFNS